MPIVSVVLCVRNGANTIDAQLEGLARQDYEGSWELVLVDNASTDGTRARVEAWRARLPQLRVVEESVVGSGGARNRGSRAVIGTRIACCDADDVVSPAWLREMLAALDRFDVVGGRLDPEPLSIHHPPRVASLQGRELPTVFGRPYSVGANLGFRAEVFEAIGGFDPVFTTGSEDADFSLRAQYAGFSIGFAPDAVVAYRVRDTTCGVMRQRFHYGESHQRLVAKHARLGRIESRPVQRWKAVAVAATRVALHLPDALRADSRLQYAASVAHVSGRVVELVTEAGRSVTDGRSAPP